MNTNYNKFDYKFLIFYIFLSIPIYFLDNYLVTLFWTTVPLLIFSFINPKLCIALYIGLAFMDSQLTSSIIGLRIIVIQLIVLLINFIIYRGKIRLKSLISLVIIIELILISLLNAKTIDINLTLLFIGTVTLVFTIYFLFNKSNFQLLLVSLILNTLAMVIILTIQSIDNFNSIFLYGRLNYEGSIRGLSNYLVLSVAILFYSIFYTKSSLLLKFINSNYQKFLFVLFSAALFLTLSLGTIFSIIFATIILILLFRKNNNIDSKTVIFVGIFSIGIYYLFSNLEMVRYERILDADFTFSGRTEIYKYTISQFLMLNPMKILFGLGSGNFEYLVSNSFFNISYPHSLFLSILFEHGVISLLILVGFLVHILLKSIRTNNGLCFYLLILSTLVYILHGVPATPLYWIIIGIITININSINDKVIG
jgi:hypothetical protein